MIYGCDLLFDADTAEKVRAEVQRNLGGPCPCMEDRPCPLLPTGLSAPQSERASA